jgi:PKD repeat protein
MTRGNFASLVMVGALACASGCTTKSQEAPPLTGPSELDQSIAVAVSPDVLPMDGASQSFVSVTARDAASQPIRNLSLRVEIHVGGVPTDFGSISARSLVTGSDGRATFVYTAPLGPEVNSDPFILVDLVVTPIGTDFNNAVPRTAAIRLTPSRGNIPPINLAPAFTVNPGSPQIGQTVLFDASSSQGQIAEYQWSFGDGSRAGGRTAQHSYDEAETFVVTLTIFDAQGRSRQTSQSITVGLGARPSAEFTFSPTAPRVGQNVNFNASASFAPSSQIVSYAWDFGDGTPIVMVASPMIAHAYATAATYNVTLVVTDSAGRSSTGKTNPVAIIP